MTTADYDTMVAELANMDQDINFIIENRVDTSGLITYLVFEAYGKNKSSVLTLSREMDQLWLDYGFNGMYIVVEDGYPCYWLM